jgi:predicted O-methyltransferase YrrM
MPSGQLTSPARTDPTRVYRYRDGMYAADLLTCAIVHFDFFSRLAEAPTDLAGICGRLGIHERPADVLLTLSMANGFVERSGGQFRVTPLACEHLTTGSPFYLGPYYASLKDRPVVNDFVRVMRTDKPAHWGAVSTGTDWHSAMADPAFAQAFTDAMDCRGLLLAQALARRVDLSHARRLLDIGGGSGIYACVLAATYPNLRATVFDQPPVDTIAARLIRRRECERQVDVAAGNFFSDRWPTGCDVHLFSNVLHDWGASAVDSLLRLSFDALAPGGLVVIHDTFINADKSGPLPVAEYSAILMHSTQGKCYATSEYEAMLAAAGFEGVTYAETAVDRGAMTARKPSVSL